MLRKKVWIAAVVTGVLVGGTQPVLLAQDTSAIRAADRQRDEMFRREAARIEAMPEGTPAERTAKLAAINQLMSQWEAAKRQTSGMLRTVEDATSGNNRNNNNTTNQQPSFLSKLADTALNIGGQVIGSLLQKWLNGGLSNEERSTLDRLMSERDAATTAGAGNPDSAAGRPIYDSNGNIVGWDRDGDNKADFGADENGNPTDWNGGSYKDGYDYSDPSTLAAAPTDPNAPASPNPSMPGAPNGRVSLGDSTGPGASGGADEAAEGDEEGKDKDEKDKDGEGEEDKDKDKDGKDKDGKATTDKDGKKRPTTGAPDTRELVSGTGKVIVLVKPEVLAGDLGLQGNTRPGTGAAAPGGKKPAGKDGGWNYQDDWADSADNGDYDESWDEEWGNGWGDQPSKTPGKTAPGQPARPGRTQPGTQPGVAGQPGAQPVPLGGGARPLTEPNLLHELGQIDTQITEWRKAERERLLREKDPYAFGNKDNLQGNYGQAKQEDPFAAYRTLEGRLDLTKVDVWLVIDESWLEGKEPRRYRLRVTEESVDQFDPVHGEYMVVQGTVVDLPVDPAVLLEIKGEVKEMEVVKVVAKSKTPPARDGTLDPLGVPGKTPAPGF